MPWPMVPGAIVLGILLLSKLRLLFTILVVSVRNRSEYGAPPAFPVVSSLCLAASLLVMCHIYLSTIPGILSIA